MKNATKQKFPQGWNEKKVRAVIEHYDRQTDEEGAAEIETAPVATGETWMSVPTELIDTITRLIEKHQRTNGSARARNRRKNSKVRN